MRWRRWSQLTQVDRVDLYTRQSLYLLLWTSALFLLITAVNSDARVEVTPYVVVLAAVLLLVLIGTAVLRDVIDLYPALGPVPRRTVLLLLVVAGALLVGSLTQSGELREVVAIQVTACLAWTLGGLRDPRWTGGLVLGLGAVTGLLTRQPFFGLSMILLAGFIVFTVRVSLWLLALVVELDAARGAQARLAVAEERLRFSRDVHDVLGRRLSTIAVQAELAATLSQRGDAEAPAMMLEVRGMAHAGLREARELARGYRPTDLAQELEGARSLLRSAGIDVRLEVDGLPAGWHEAAGWVVREAVTNLLRHSAATRVEVEYADGELRVVNDGVTGPPGPAGSEGSEGGAGLAGLRERLVPLGAGLAAELVGESWRVVVSLPGAGPVAPDGAAGGSPARARGAS